MLNLVHAESTNIAPSTVTVPTTVTALSHDYFLPVLDGKILNT